MSPPNNDRPRANVVLLHGMARSSRSMLLIAADLRRAGYRVHNLDYPTRPYGVEDLAQRFVAPAIESCDRQQPIHIVTHSLGGILARCYLQTASLPPGSRIVMLAPPNQGSQVADLVRSWAPYRVLMGRVGQQLGTGSDGVVRRLGPIGAEVGVIAANRSWQPWFSPLLPGEDDGAVSVTSTRLPEMCDFMVVETTHTLIVLNRRVRHQVFHFLAKGRFDRSDGISGF